MEDKPSSGGLPNEVLLEILSHLSGPDATRLGYTNSSIFHFFLRASIRDAGTLTLGGPLTHRALQHLAENPNLIPYVKILRIARHVCNARNHFSVPVFPNLQEVVLFFTDDLYDWSTNVFCFKYERNYTHHNTNVLGGTPLVTRDVRYLRKGPCLLLDRQTPRKLTVHTGLRMSILGDLSHDPIPKPIARSIKEIKVILPHKEEHDKGDSYYDGKTWLVATKVYQSQKTQAQKLAYRRPYRPHARDRPYRPHEPGPPVGRMAARDGSGSSYAQSKPTKVTSPSGSGDSRVMTLNDLINRGAQTAQRARTGSGGSRVMTLSDLNSRGA